MIILDNASTKIKPDAGRDILMMTMLKAAEHLSDILAEFEYAPRHQLRFKLNDLLQLVINLNSNHIATIPAGDVYHTWLSEVNRIAQGKFDLSRFVE